MANFRKGLCPRGQSQQQHSIVHALAKSLIHRHYGNAEGAGGWPTECELEIRRLWIMRVQVGLRWGDQRQLLCGPRALQFYRDTSLGEKEGLDGLRVGLRGLVKNARFQMRRGLNFLVVVCRFAWALQRKCNLVCVHDSEAGRC